mmetsp:Transcript_29156/g.42815  ORF Transcript_29156/g.42815 Transcript_29156/m.42815 type:complete len:123 (-) Transcript_29156:155-523(-)
MVFFGFGTSATLIDDEPIIPEEPELLDALRAAYRDPNVSTTKAMHQTVLVAHPKWIVNLKRVRKLLSKVVETAEPKETGDADLSNLWVEEDIEGWCLISKTLVTAPAVVPRAASAALRGRVR